MSRRPSGTTRQGASPEWGVPLEAARRGPIAPWRAEQHPGPAGARPAGWRPTAHAANFRPSSPDSVAQTDRTPRLPKEAGSPRLRGRRSVPVGNWSASILWRDRTEPVDNFCSKNQNCAFLRASGMQSKSTEPENLLIWSLPERAGAAWSLRPLSGMQSKGSGPDGVRVGGRRGSGDRECAPIGASKSGGGGNRTPVQRKSCRAFYTLSRLFDLVPCAASRRASRETSPVNLRYAPQTCANPSPLIIDSQDRRHILFVACS